MRSGFHYVTCLLSFLLFCPVLQAQEPTPYPPGCQADGYEFVGQLLDLQKPSSAGDQAPQVYLIQNNSAQPIYLDHKAEKPGTASAGWMSKLEPQHWSALLVTQPNFKWMCQQISLTAVRPVACSKTVRVCRYPVKNPTTDSSSQYWLSENQNLEMLLGAIKSRGIQISDQ